MRVKTSVPLPEARRRALAYLAKQSGLINASSVAYAIWPDCELRAQGAASRVLKSLEKDGLARWTSAYLGRSWGWEITAAGKKAAR